MKNLTNGTRIAAVLAAGFLALGAWGDTVVIDGVTWTYSVNYDGEHAVTLGGGGASSSSFTPAKDKNTEVDAANIPWTFTVGETKYTVTRIANYAFYKDRKLTGTMEIPDAVTEVGKSSFSGCTGLAAISSLGGVVTIGEYGFGYSNGMNYVCDISDLTKVVNMVGQTFRGCANVTGRVRLNPALEAINTATFMETSITAVDIPQSVTAIGGSAFKGTALTGLLIPGISTTFVNTGNTLENCSNLKTVLCGPNAMTNGYYKADNLMLKGDSNVKIFVPTGRGWNSTNIGGTDTAIYYYGEGEDLDFDIDTDNNVITATVKTESALSNVLSEAALFKSEFGMDTKVRIANAIAVSPGAITPEMMSVATFGYLSFEVKSQAQLDNVLAAVTVDFPIAVDIEGTKDVFTVPAGRSVGVLSKSGWVFKKSGSGLSITFP